MQYRREIDGLRAIAVLPVILFHAGFTVFSGGFVGVDVFFVISGYLITRILIEDIDRGNFSIAKFYERRARRILPALFVVLLVAIALASLWMLPAQAKSFSQSLVAVTLFSSNILFWLQSGYFATDAGLIPLLHTWSLAVEEQYYLVFPLFLALLWRFPRKRVFWSIVAIAIASFLLSEWGWRHRPDANFYLAPTRAWELLTGSVAAFLSVGKAQRSNDLLGAAGLGLILYSVFFYDENTPFPSAFALAPVVGTALIILFAGPMTWAAKLLSTRPLVSVGLISYSAYLWHQPLFAFVRIHSLTTPPPLLMAGLAVASLLLAWVTWRWVELPFRRRAGPVLPSRRGLFVASGIVSGAFLALGGAWYLNDGFTWELTDSQKAMVRSAARSPMRRQCHFDRTDSFGAAESCVLFGDAASWAVYGNSHGVEISYALAQLLRDQTGESLVQFTVSSCPASFRIEAEAYCDGFFKDRLAYILSHGSIETVVLSFRSEEFGAASAASLIDLANYLASQGKRVVLLLQAPVLPHDIHAYLRIALSTSVQDVAARPRDEWRALYADVYAQLDRLDRRVTVIDVADSFCDTITCYAIRNNVALYLDDDHMSVSGARLVAEKILAAFE